MGFEIFSSNRVEILFEECKESLFQKGTHPFQRRFVIVPSPAMKVWLQLSLARDPHCGIATGIDIGNIDQSLGKLHRYLFQQPAERFFSPSVMELSWMIEVMLRKVIHIANQGSEGLWQPLLEYLKGGNFLKKKQEQRLFAFSSTLASLYFKYGQYGCQMLEEWEKGEIEHWQAAFWRLLKEHFPSFRFPYQQLGAIGEQKAFCPEGVSVHLFAVSFLPRRAHAFFKEISAIVPVKYYLLSPCQLFWGDICSDKEKRKAREFWQFKGASEKQLTELELFLNERNALLANLGKMGREMAQLVEESGAAISDCYLLPQSVNSSSHYQELLTDEVFHDSSSAPLTLLQAIQADMVLLRNPNSQDKLDFPQEDRSIQFHRAPTKQREIESLYNALVHIVTTHANQDNPILPSDIVVLAPDLAQYEAPILSIFGSEDSALGCQLMEVQSASKSSLVRGFLHLLKLGTSRWELETVLSLIEYEEFQRKWKISYQDLLQIREWSEKSGIFWGQTVSHRQDTLSRDHHECSLADCNPMGTWEYGIGRLLMGLAVDPSRLESVEFGFELPIEAIDTSEVELFGKWMRLLSQLKRDLQPIVHGSSSLEDWSVYLKSLKEMYFQVDPADKDSVAIELILISQIQAIATAARIIPEELFAFDSIYQQLEKNLVEEKRNYRETDLQSVRFCSMLPMRALPAKVVVLIGMGEGAFPREEIITSLNLITSFNGNDYSPSQTDFDRYLFLEALLSARCYFLLSYVGYSLEEQRECYSSLLIRELLSYIDEGYTIDGNTPSTQLTYNHPVHSFHRSYFEKGGISYLQHHYRMAVAHYGEEKREPHRMISNFFCKQKAFQPDDEPIVIAIKDLTDFASNPIKTYFNKKLNMYIDKKEKNNIEENFVLSPLSKYQLRRQAVQNPISKVFDRAFKEGKLPPGIFRVVASQNLEKEISEMHANFTRNDINLEGMTSITFSEQCDFPEFSPKKGWVIPCLSIAGIGKKVKIIGSIKDVTAEGILVHNERDIKNFVKLWPQYLLLHHAIQFYSLPIKAQIFSVKHPKPIVIAIPDPIKPLCQFLEYYFSGIHSLSLLLPEWIPSLLKGEADFDKIIHADLTDEFRSFYNEYALWLFREQSSLSAESLEPAWNEIAISLFGQLPFYLKY